MPETGKFSLSLKIAGGGFDDFLPHELTLEEGFSQVYRAELTVFTKTRREHKDLRELLERNVSLTVSQRLAGGLVSRRRYLHGLITGIADVGVASRGESASCYRHILTIESELARLRHTSFNNPWYRKTPPDIIEEILGRYGITAKVSNEYIDRSCYAGNLMFEQVNASDLDFIRYITELYGLSWTFAHGKVPENSLGTAELHFCEGGRFPHPVYEYTDNRKISEVERFDFLTFDEKQNLWKMDRWRMEGRIGVDGMEVNAPYPQAGSGSQEWRWGSIAPGKRCHSYSSLFHGYERGTAQDSIDKDIKQIIEARRIALTLEQEDCIGEAENILPAPGLLLELSHFHGTTDNTPVTALVTDSTLRFRSPWPRDMMSPPAGEEPGELAQVEFRAKNWGKDSEKRFCRYGQPRR